MSFLQEFKRFAMRGNVVDLAVAVIIGAAFGKIISSLVDGIIMPLIGLLLGGINIADKTFVFGQATIKWGLFLQSVIDFTIITFSIFVALKIINSLQQKDSFLVSKMSDEVKLLSEIRDLLKQSQQQP
jgi:large conductance mechanosensitive channel